MHVQAFIFQTLDVSFNRINRLDWTLFNSNPSCLQFLETLDLSNNNLIEIPSLFIRKIPNLKDLYLQNNNLISLDLALLVLVSSQVNLSNNQISRVTNAANINISSYGQVRVNSINLVNNSGSLDLTDTIFEMYGACSEISIANTNVSVKPILTNGMGRINFGESKINCSCNQYYLQQRMINAFPPNILEVSPPNLQCSNGILLYNSNITRICSTSSASFRTSRPRLCKIQSDNESLFSWNITDANIEVSRK